MQLCVDQLSAALSLDPAGERGLELVEQLTKAYPAVVSQIPRSGEAFFGMVALRALLVSRYDAVEALELLEEVLAFRPTVPYVQWLERGTVGASDAQALEQSAGRICRSLLAASPQSMAEVNGLRANLRSLAMVAQRAWAEGPRRPTFLDVEVSCIAKLGCGPRSVDPWLDLLTPQHAFELLNGLGRLALKERRYTDATEFALRAFDNGPVLPAGSELTLQLIEAGAFSEAGRVLSRLGSEPSAKIWAETHRTFVDALTGDAEACQKLGVRAEQQDPLALALFKEVGVYRVHLPDPWEPASTLVRRALKLAASSGGDTLQDTHRQVLCASAYVAYEAGLIQLGLKEETSPGAVASSDQSPWAIVSKGSEQGVRLPESSVVERVTAIAESPFELANWARAVEGVRQLELRDVEGELLACFGGLPQQCPLHPVAWLFRVQVTSALALAALVTTTDSPAAQVLVELVGLANDWSSAAGALALGYLGHTHVEYEAWAKATLDAVLVRGALPNAAAEHAMVVARSWFEGSATESFGQLWSRRMKLSPR